MAFAETVMFAIQAGLRLFGAARKAYADSVRGRALILPLPRMPGVRVDSAVQWFYSSDPGQKLAEETPRIKWLLDRPDLTESQTAELVDLYVFHWSQINPEEPGATDVRGNLSTMEMHALLEVRQWSDSEASEMATPLQTIAGTLVNIAVDYFVQNPGAVSEDRPAGRALKAFLEALDETDFAEVPPKEIASGLMLAVLDTVSEHPDLIAGGDNEQELISHVSKTLAGSATAFLEEGTDKELRRAGVWLQLVGHAVLKGAAETVLAKPGHFLKLKPGAESEVVVEVGKTMTDLLLGERQLTFRRLFSAEGLNKVTKSALSAVAKNPDILKIDNQGLKNLIIAVADDVSKLDDSLSADMFPELVRIVLDRTGDNLDLIWGRSFRRPQRHLLVTAVTTLLKSFARKPDAGSTWKPQFTPDQFLEVGEAVLDEVVDNPAWLLDSAGQASSHLQAALEAILAALRKMPGNRVSADAGIAILRAGIGAVALRLPLLDELPPTADEPARTAITAALDAIYSEIFGDDASAEVSWNVARNSTLVTLTEISLEGLGEIGAEQKHITALRQAVRDLIASSEPFEADQFADDLYERLRAA